MNSILTAVADLVSGVIKLGIKSIICRNIKSKGVVKRISMSTEISVSRNGELTTGKNLILKRGTVIAVRDKGMVCIGDNFFMNRNSMITAWERINIGNNVQFGPGVLVYDQDHDYKADGGLAAEKYKTAPVTIGNNVWIGANCIILKGTMIGDNSVIAAGTIVNNTIPPNTLVYQERKNAMKEIFRG